VLRNFLDSIDTPGNPDGKLTREKFMNYYAGVSLTVDDDSYFDRSDDAGVLWLAK
jgi:hypothetical protein